MKSTSNETQTQSDEDNKKSSWAKFCNKRGINPNLLMLKVTLFVMHGGKEKNVIKFATHLFQINETTSVIQNYPNEIRQRQRFYICSESCDTVTRF